MERVHLPGGVHVLGSEEERRGHCLEAMELIKDDLPVQGTDNSYVI